MGEAILVKAGGLGGNGGSNPEDKNIISWELKTELITNSQQFIVPKAKNQQFSVRIFGGGGTAPTIGSVMGYYQSWISGGSGNMNFGEFKLNKGDIIPIVIGDAKNGLTNSSIGPGGTTSFGTYLSATGGGIADYINNKGADGGVGSPAVIEMNGWKSVMAQNKVSYSIYSVIRAINAGKSYYGGGSGGCGVIVPGNVNCQLRGADGGTYGGGGGSPIYTSITNGGKGCGKGGNNSIEPTNGTNTKGIILNNFNGYGLKGNKYGGGGGYGGDGGNGYESYNQYGNNDMGVYDCRFISCGGGGGYGAKGGSADQSSAHFQLIYVKDIYSSTCNMIISGQCGGGYGNDHGGYGNEGYGCGAFITTTWSGISLSKPKNGICILSYYAPVYK